MKDPADSHFNCHVNPITFGSKKRNPQANPRTFHAQDPQSHGSWPSDINSDVNVFHQSRPRRLVVAQGNRGRRICRTAMCGACLTVFLFEIKNKQLIISIPTENKQILTGATDGSSEVSKEVLSSPNGGFNAEGMDCSASVENPAHDFQSSDFKRNIRSEVQRLNLTEFEKGQHLTSLASVSSEDEEPQDRRNIYGEGNKSNRTDQKKAKLDKSTPQQNSVKDASETEVEVSFNEYTNTSLSQYSEEIREEKDQSTPSRINKVSESVPLGLLKKQSRSNHQMEGEKYNISVNGQPIPESMVKKAEKLAGPIHPGDYWYDFQAGFWGVMGQPCVGIIPPFIKEFDYPMPENCAAGNTSVFVNGRELHQKDLDLLASRGLPTTRDKFYTVSISGEVLDQESGMELKSLGKLAPTVQKQKRGFGMKVPRRKLT
ncbi:hypothetical protein GH714_005593 [Hevea brasiliensis]|uniref:Uncharacterized protein n=1 Tax=Hevea brasiliensis TaxID=3981 RepID=A0A6A6L907_HEVBR|nr:hypothetical protein GH714_005593 [Hevea brasiliensis]